MGTDSASRRCAAALGICVALTLAATLPSDAPSAPPAPAPVAAAPAPAADPVPAARPAPTRRTRRPRPRPRPRPKDAAPEQPRRPARKPAATPPRPPKVERAIRKRRRLPVYRAIRRARRDGAITRAEAERYRVRMRTALHRARTLPGIRGRELRSVVQTLDGIARRGRLTPARMPALFLQLRRNNELWGFGRIPSPGARLRFADDPLVLEYVPGHGMQLHPLANFAQANKLRNQCEGPHVKPHVPCRKDRLRRLLDRIASMTSSRGGFATWEYNYPRDGAEPPWISGMAQATGLQALSRGARLLKRPRYLRIARSGLRAFRTRPPLGVSVPTPRGRHFAMYSYAPRLRIINGFLQSVSGLLTFARISDSPTAWALYRLGDRQARHELPGFDTGSWSLYSRPGGAPASEEYHRLARDFLGMLCDRAGTKDYCQARRRFTRYLRVRR